MELMGFLAYLLTKFAAYSGWGFAEPRRKGPAQLVLWIPAFADGGLLRNGNFPGGINDE